MKTYKYKMSDQSNLIRLGNLIDDVHQVHAYFHRWQRQRYKEGLPYANYAAMCEHLTECKQTTQPHWNALPSQVLQEELKRIDAAYQRFFKKQGGKPHIKPRHKFKSVTFRAQAGWKLSDNRITLTLRKYNRGKWRYDRVPYTFFKHRAFEGKIRTVTIKRDTVGDYWLFLTTDFTDTELLQPTGESVGADFGMKDAFLTLSNGEKIQSPQFLKQSLKALRTLSKSLYRKVKGSGNWWRAVRQLARLYRKVSNQRRDWHWKLANDLCKRFDTIVLETLNIDGMKRLWGRKVSDLAFYQFVEMLRYKCQKHKRQFLQVEQWTATTKPCSNCGYHNKDLSLSDRRWICPKCNLHHDRDINAAINIKRAGIAAQSGVI